MASKVKKKDAALSRKVESQIVDDVVDRSVTI